MGGTVTTGWHPDPFGLHEARYFSADGQPTKLVRDRGLESYDEPPSDPDEVAAAMARMLAPPAPPSAYPPRDAYQYDRARDRDSWRPSIRQFAVTWVIAVAAAVGIYFGAQAMLSTPEPAGTPGGLTMDLTYSAAPLQVTAPPAASTTTIAAFLQQLGHNPAGQEFQVGAVIG